MKLPPGPWWLHPNRFQADGDSVVELVNRYQLRYREGNRSMLIEQELQADPHDVVIDRSSMIAWEPPHDGDLVDEADKDRIVENMRRAFAARHYRLDTFDETPPMPRPSLPASALPVMESTAEQFALALFEHFADGQTSSGEPASTAATGEPGTPNAGAPVWRVQLTATYISPGGETRPTLWTIEVNRATGDPSVSWHGLDT